MKRKKVMAVLSIVAFGAVAIKVVRGRAKPRYIETKKKNDKVSDKDDSEDIETEREEVLEKILSEMEEMYRDREEFVPVTPPQEEVPIPEKPKKKSKGVVKKAALIAPVIAMLMGTTRGYTGYQSSAETEVIYEDTASESVEADNYVSEIIEPEESVAEDIYEDVPELIAMEEEISLDESEELEKESINRYSEEDIYLLAQLIVNESGNQERAGQIGVAEVVLNRLNSSKFPDTVSEVIYQNGQFSNNKAIKTRNPNEDIVDIAENVLNGDLRVFNNADVLYFRNPMITSGIRPEEEVDWGRCRYFTYIGGHAFYLKAGASNAKDENAVRLRIVETAKAYAEKVKSYEFGGKPNGTGDANTNMDLDCSGYVSWVLGEALGMEDVSQSMMGSANVNSAFGLKEVSKDELSVGDIGYRYEPGTIKPTNHCGIYAGNGKWIHCNSKDDGVIEEDTDMFKHYYSAI